MSVIPVNAAVVQDNTIVKADVLTAGKAVKMKAIPNGKYILSEGENGVAPENITLKRVGKNLHVILEGSDIEHPELIIEGFYDTPGELVGKAEDGQWHEYIATSGEEKDDAAFLMDGEISPVALNAAPYANGASLDNLSFAAFALSPAMIALGALAALAAATGLGYAVGKHNSNNDNDKSSGSGNAGGGNDYDDGSNGGPNIPTSVVIGSVTDQRGNVINPGDHSSEKSPVFTGTGKPGNKIEVIDNGKIIDEVMIGEDGNWSWTPKPALGDGDHDIVLVERDPITGKPSLPLPGFELIVDTVAPGKAEIEDLHDEEGVSIINPPSFEIADVSVYNNEIYTNKNRPTLIGTAERNTFVDVYLNGVKVGEAEVNGQGTWRFPFPSALPDDRYSFHVVNRDKAGNTGLPSSQLIINIDTVAPDEPVITVIEDGSGNPITGGTQELEPVVKGTASPSEAGAKIELRDQDGNVLGTTTVRDDGSWEVVVSPALTEGNYEIIAVIIDKAGNKTEMTTPVNLEVDLTAPELPGGGSIGLPGDVLEGAWDNVEPQTGWIDPTTPTNDARPEFRGAGLEEGDTVYIIDQAATPAQVLGTAIVGSDGRWSFEPATDMGEGEHRVAIIVRDDAGNESPLSDEFVFEIDTVAPADPRPGIGPDSPFEGAWDDQGDYTGWIGADSTTDDAQPEFKGSTLNDGDIVVIYNGDRVIGSALVQADGTWSWTPSTPLLNGDYDISIAVRDAAGNESARTDSLEFTISAGGRPGVPGVDGVYNDDGAVPELSYSLASREIRMSEPLAAKGLLSEVEMLRMRRQANDILSQITERKNRYQAEANSELIKLELELSQTTENLVGRADIVDRTTVTAPVRGTIKNVRVSTIGGVIQPGEHIMEIIPLEDQLLVETQIRPSDVAFLRPGLKATVKITAYDYAIYGGLTGVVENISPDTLKDDQKAAAGRPDAIHYRVMVLTDNSHLEAGGKQLPIIPGMVASVEIKTGEKTILDYLLKPVLKAREAFRER